MEGNKGRSGSSKYWATILYDVKDISVLDKALKSMHMQCILSPLHDKDTKEYIDEINGHVYKSLRFKEPHYHLMVHFPNGVSLSSFLYLLEHKIPEGIHHKGHELIFNFEGMARYFAHLDDLDKYQYDVDDILYYGGLDESCLISPKKDNIDKYGEIAKYINIIYENQIEDMMTFFMYMNVNRPSEVKLALRYSKVLETYTRGMYQSNQRRKELLSK